MQFHEQELESPNRSGREWFGESFGSINQRTFTFATPYPTGEAAKVSGRFAAQSMGVQSSFSVTSGDIAFDAAPSYTSSTSTSNVANLASAAAMKVRQRRKLDWTQTMPWCRSKSHLPRASVHCRGMVGLSAH